MSLTREILKPDFHCLFNQKVTLSKLMSMVLPGSLFGRYLIGQGHRVISVRPDMLQVLYVLQETMSERSEDSEEWGDQGQCDHQQGEDPYYKYKRLYKDKLAELEYKYDEVNVYIYFTLYFDIFTIFSGCCHQQRKEHDSSLGKGNKNCGWSQN